MDKQAQRFLATWVLSCVVLASVAAVFSILMDPYLVFGAPRIAGLNARKPAANAQERLVKAIDVLRAVPSAVVLGSSRVDAGLDTRDSVWSLHSDPIYNLGFGGASPYVAYRYLQHVTSRRPLALVMLGLDFEYFLKYAHAGAPTHLEKFESYLAVTRDGRANADRLWQYALSFDGLTDSAMTLIANLRNEFRWDFTSAGNWDAEITRLRIAKTGSYVRVAWTDMVALRVHFGKNKHVDPLVLADVQAILNLCESQGTQVILFINPVHADTLEIMDLAGYWLEFEDWKRQLMVLTTKYTDSRGNSRIPLWDFSGYDSYSTETVARRGLLRWFWESNHYTPELGNLMFRRMFGSDNANFGVLLQPETLESHLATIREHQRLYREHHSADVRRVRDLYGLVVSSKR